ncbi:hypothetical protein HMPREF1140_0208 [Lachnoanaerobaculum sp. ICM7]|nr:hypothetical protein HMPREF1140_0208 [Lachnoanaerobaculum sp. ICM7]
MASDKSNARGILSKEVFLFFDFIICKLYLIKNRNNSHY